MKTSFTELPCNISQAHFTAHAVLLRFWSFCDGLLWVAFLLNTDTGSPLADTAVNDELF